MGARNDYAGMDPYEQIQACLKCKKSECDNCVYTSAQKAKKRRPAARRTPSRRKTERPKSDPCQVCPMRKLCKANHWICGERARWKDG